MMRQDDLVFGIDLGTYNSAACVLMGGQVLMLRPEEGQTDQGMCFPSMVEFDEAGEFLQAGELARRALPLYPESVVWGVKRLIGRSYESAQQSGELRRYAYRIEKGPDGGCLIRVGQRSYTPREITTFLLQKIKKDAEADFNPIGRAIQEAVVTVPAYFDPVQKLETEQAALAAGFERVYLLPEPTAAASAYRLQAPKENQYMVVIDLGAGTLDVTVALLYVDANGQLQTVEKSHGGDTALGGLDMDDALMEFACKQFGLQKMVQDPQARMRLRTELERAKIRLSTAQETQLLLSWENQSLKLPLTRQQLEQAVRPIVDRCRGPIRVALEEAGLSPQDISHVLLVGGPTMMPIVRRMVAEEFQENPQIVEELAAIDQKGFPVNPMEAVARGSVLGVAGKITPHGYGILWDEYYELIGRRQRYPGRGEHSFLYFGKERSIHFSLVRQSINPQTHREEYILLGDFQFDCVPASGMIEITMEWEYTDNGILHFEISQPGGVKMPLHEISRLDGRPIPRPPRPNPREADIPAEALVHAMMVQRQEWSHSDLQKAIQAGQQILQTARNKCQQATAASKEQMLALCEELEGWLQADTADPNRRTPQIRNLCRSLLNLLYVNRLISPAELNALNRSL